MSLVESAGAWCNGEVAYIAWKVDHKIKDCVGFMVTRVHLSGPDKGARRILPTWIAFTDQNNPNWNAQDASVWPIQNFEWRDLTLRKSRDTTAVRPINFEVYYEIVPVRLAKAGEKALPASSTAPDKDDHGLPSYEGPHHPLVAMDKPVKTNKISVTHTYGSVKATFTNGILSTQNLLQQLSSVNKAPPKQALKNASSKKKADRVKAAKVKEDHLLSVLKKEIVKPESPIRKFLTGDVYDFVSSLVERARTNKAKKAQVYLALYELHDPELITLLLEAVKEKLVHLILTTAGNFNPNPKGTAKEDRKPVLWDTENDDPRQKLHTAAGKDSDRIIDRMFNSSARIGHNKFAVYVEGTTPKTVMTGSTNWTETGLCTQSNNCIIVEDEDLAADYFAYWERLRDDKQPARKPLKVTKGKKTVKGAAPNTARQGEEIRTDNQREPTDRTLDGEAEVRAWFSPNTDKPVVPKKNPGRPVDLAEVYDRMDKAESAVMFLVFMPGRGGINNIIGEAASVASSEKLGKSDGESLRLAKKLTSIEAKGRFVMGAISDPTAMPGYTPPPKGAKRPKGIKLPPPAIWWPDGDKSKVAMIRAAAVRIPFGNLRPELLSAGHAIIHDKIIVIDPLDEKHCTVITGSHNLGYKASYCNDENMLIITGNRDLAISYAVHVIDLYEHYLMRARLEEKIRQDIMAGKLKSYEEAAAEAVPHGLLALDDIWQARHLGKDGQSSLDYFLANAPKPYTGP